MFEPREPGFRQRVYMHNLATAALGTQEGRQHAWMISARILSDYENRVAKIEVFQRHCAFAETDCFFHSGAAGFVTHVGAIGKVVRAELPHEQLIKKSRFIAGATGGVEDRFVR